MQSSRLKNVVTSECHGTTQILTGRDIRSTNLSVSMKIASAQDACGITPLLWMLQRSTLVEPKELAAIK